MSEYVPAGPSFADGDDDWWPDPDNPEQILGSLSWEELIAVHADGMAREAREATERGETTVRVPLRAAAYIAAMLQYAADAFEREAIR